MLQGSLRSRRGINLSVDDSFPMSLSASISPQGTLRDNESKKQKPANKLTTLFSPLSKVRMMLFLSSAGFFQNQLFRKILSGLPSECQIVCIQFRPDVLSGLNWIQTVCKSLEFFHFFCRLLIFFKINFFKNYFRSTTRVTNNFLHRSGLTEWLSEYQA